MGVQSGDLVTAQFTGVNGPGTVSVPGLKVGDVVFASKEGAGMVSSFETVISVNDEIQQTAFSDFSAATIHLVMFRGSFA